MTLHLDSNRISGHGWPEICWLHMLEICRMLVAYELLEMSSFTHKGCSPYYNFASPLRMCLLTLVTVVAAKPCDAVAANTNRNVNLCLTSSNSFSRLPFKSV